MSDYPATLQQFNTFFSAFSAWEDAQQKKPLQQLQTFLTDFQRLESQSPKPDAEQATPQIVYPRQQYKNFFKAFKPLYKSAIKQGAEVNVWQQAGLKHDEVRNTAALTWWLDCNGTHAQKDRIFRTLLNALPQSNQLPQAEETGNYQITAESLPLGDPENRIDIEIQGTDFLIFIEVKINAGEGQKQLERYQTLLHEKADLYNLKKRALIYLTRYNSSQLAVDECLCISWRQLALALEKTKLTKQSHHTQQLLWQFCRHIQAF